MDFRDIKEFIADTLKYILTIAVVIFIVVYVVTVQQVVGPSMSPTYKDQDIVFLNKFYYHLFDIRRFDVVSLKYDGTKYLIKRVIGMPGEKVEYKNNILYINDVGIKEPFLADSVITDDFSITKLGYDKIPDDMYLVLGDNRKDSYDSRDIGLIPKDNIIGKVNIRIWPLNKISYIK